MYKLEQNKKQFLWGAASFFLPIFLFLCVLSAGGFYPFGEKTMLVMDMKGQYVEFLTSLRYALSGENSLFFSWSRSMGGNYWGIFTYYIASPLSFITLFFPVENMPVAIEVLTLLKSGLCGLSFFTYGRYITRQRTGLLAGKGIEPLLLILSICYVFMSYNMVYSLSIMWLDSVILLPVILMGLEKILDGNKGLLYLASLSMLFISNYYTGYMAGLYTGMYLLFRVLTRITKAELKQWLLKILRFTILSLLSIGIAAPVIAGALKDLMQGKLSYSGDGYQFDLSQTNFLLKDFPAKFLNSSYDSITNTGLPSIYCGYFVLILAIIFFILRGIKLREKAGMLIITVILCASFYFTSLDTAWHGFQVPNWFPYRYAFLFSFTLLYMACRALMVLPPLKRHIEEQAEMDYTEGQAVQTEETQTKARKPAHILTPMLTIIIAIAVIADMGINAYHMLAGLDKEFSYGLVSEYNDFIDKTKPLVNDIQEKDNGFYRINQGYEYSKNDAMLLGYNGMTHYSSTFNAAINNITLTLGISQGYFWNSGYGSNALLDSLFAAKYILADRIVPGSYIKNSDSQKGTASYENPLSLPIAYGCIPSTMEPGLSDTSPFTNQNQFISAIAGKDIQCFTSLGYNSSQDKNMCSFNFTAPSPDPLYIYMKSENTPYANVYVNGTFAGGYFSN